MYQNLGYYKPETADVIHRMTRTREDALHKKNGNILFRVLPPSDIQVYSDISVNSYNYEDDLDNYVEDLMAAYARSFEARKDIHDDALPIITPVLGIGDYSAFLAGDIYFSKDTSWSRPSLEDISEWRSLPAIGSTFWYKKFLAICDKLLTASKGTGIPFTRGFFSPLDLAEALRGNKIYYDFTDHPDELHDLLDFCADATIRFAEDIYAIARRHLSAEKFGLWFVEDSINMSEDIACMISPDLYREFGAPHTQKVIDHFGKGFMHTHSRALYMVKEICSLKNVANLWLATDPSQPIPVQCLEQLIPDAQSTCLAIDCASFEEFESTLDTALQGNVSYCLPVDTVEEGIILTDRANALLSRKGVI
ncbi:MAG: uroporphyrinogen decarboxylase/cobalamine-independent methonine synthase family protein [Saccharofermentanales bacterium]